jgi:hypothetical protein
MVSQLHECCFRVVLMAWISLGETINKKNSSIDSGITKEVFNFANTAICFINQALLRGVLS